MKIKRYFAPDMRQAKRLVRQEVGPDAVILSNKRVAGGVEIMVAIDYEPPVKSAPLPQTRAADPIKDERASTSPLSHGRTQPPKPAAGASSSPLSQRFQQVRDAQQGRIHEPIPTKSSPTPGLDKESVAELLRRLEQERQSRRSEHAVREYGSVAHEGQAPQSSSEYVDTFSQEVRPLKELTSARPVNPEQHVELELPNSHQGEARRQDDSRVINSMRGEIEQLKGMLEQQLKNTQQAATSTSFTERSKPLQIQIQTRLHKMGLSVPLSRQLIHALDSGLEPKQAWRQVLQRLAAAISTFDTDPVESGGMFALVGPTGSGKTTTIGKLATRYVLRHGSAGLALVTTDCYRVAAHEQLRVFGHILDVPVRVVDERHSLNETLRSLRDKNLVLVDTAGMSTQDVHRDKQLHQLSQVSIKLRKLLVLPCTSQVQVLRSAYQSYRPLGIDAGILTKLDEAVNLGEALSVIIEHALKIAYITDGQRVPDDLALAKSGQLVSRAVHAIDNLMPAAVSSEPARTYGRAG